MDFSEFGMASVVILAVMCTLAFALIGYGYYLNRRENQIHSSAFQSAPGFGSFNTATDGASTSTQKNDSMSTGAPVQFAQTREAVKQRTAKPSVDRKFIPTPRIGPKGVRPTANTTSRTKPKHRTESSWKRGKGGEQPIFDSLDESQVGLDLREGIVKHVVREKDIQGNLQVRELPTGLNRQQTENLIASALANKGSKRVQQQVNSPEAAKVQSESTEVKTTPHQEPAIRGTPNKDSITAQSDSVKKTSQTSTGTEIRTKAKVVERKVRPSVMKSKTTKRSKTTENTSTSGNQSADEYVILSVVGPHQSTFPVKELAKFLLARGLVIDKLGLFCKVDQQSGKVLFKIADAYAPGHFDVNATTPSSTAGITLVMWLARVMNPQSTFEQMLSIAKDCASSFGAELQDEQSNKLSNQTIAHYRNRISDYRRKQMTM